MYHPDITDSSERPAAGRGPQAEHMGDPDRTSLAVARDSHRLLLNTAAR